MKSKISMAVVAVALIGLPIPSHAFIFALITGTVELARSVARDASTASGVKEELKQQPKELTWEEKKARDEVMKQTFEELTVQFPENEREQEMDKLHHRFMVLAPEHPLVTERLDILRDEAAAAKAKSPEKQTSAE